MLDLAGGDGATRAHIESTRRAVLRLAAHGLVETRHVNRERPIRGTGRLTSYGDLSGRLYPVRHCGTASCCLLAARLRLSVENLRRRDNLNT